MKKAFGVRVSESCYRLLTEMAKAQGRGISQYASELLEHAVRNQAKETRDLERFMSTLSSLSELLQQSLIRQGPGLTKEDLLLALTVMANYWFLDATKRQKFVQELEEKLGGGR